MKTLIIALSLFTTDTLPPKATLLQAIDSFYQVQTTSQLLEYQTSQKGEWLKYLPTVGLTYTLDGKPRPAISFSSSLLYRAKKDRQTIMAKRQAIIEANRITAQGVKTKLEEMIFEYECLQQEIASRREIFEIDAQLFEMDQQRYERLEMAPSDFLKSKKVFLEKQQAFRKLSIQAIRLEKGILNLSFLLEQNND